MAREGAKHLYLLDFNDTELVPFAKDLQHKYPSTKVRCYSSFKK